MILPAISIRQPWAHWILRNGKDVENRTWACPRQYIGQRVLIHAGAQIDSNALKAWIKQKHDATPQRVREVASTFSTGGIVGIVTITGCVQDSASPWAEPGVFHWLLAEAKPLPFHPCKGRLGFFQVDYPHEVPA